MIDDVTQSLLLRLRDGHTDAAALLESIYRDRLRAFAYGYLRDHQAAEDAVQDVFLRVLTADTVPDAFRPWIYRITRNHCLNRLRAKGRRRDGARLATHLDAWDGAAGALTRFVGDERRADVAAALEALPLEQQEALRLRYADGLSRAEIAALLDVPASTVKSRLFTALKTLRARLNPPEA